MSSGNSQATCRYLSEILQPLRHSKRVESRKYQPNIQGMKSDAGNHRPVSLTSVPCKVMETIIKESLATFLDDKSELSKLQHGLTKGRSCLTNLLESFEAWTRLLEEGYGVDIIYLDYRRYGSPQKIDRQTEITRGRRKNNQVGQSFCLRER